MNTRAPSVGTRHFLVMNRIMKVLVGSVVVVSLFVCGMVVGAKMVLVRQQFSVLRSTNQAGRINMMNFDDVARGRTSFVLSRDGMMNQGYGMGMYAAADTVASGTVRILGSVSKIDGNKITIVDNAAKNQVIMSQATTMIRSSAGVLSLLGLKVGQTVIVTGVATSEGVIEARFIDAL